MSNMKKIARILLIFVAPIVLFIAGSTAEAIRETDPLWVANITSLTDNHVPKTFNGSLVDSSIYVDNSGNVGINTASPTAVLEVNGSVKAVKSLTLINDGGFGDFVFKTGTNTNYLSNSNANGIVNVAGGKGWSDGAALAVYGDSAPTGAGMILLRYGSQINNLTTAKVLFQRQEPGPVFTSVAEFTYNKNVLLVHGSGAGYVGIGTSSPSRILTIGQGKGNPIADGWDVYSDEKLKKNKRMRSKIEKEDTLEKMKLIKTYEYDYKEGERLEHKHGLVANDIMTIFPDVVHNATIPVNCTETVINNMPYMDCDDEQVLTIDTYAYMVKLTEAVQILAEKVDKICSRSPALCS